MKKRAVVLVIDSFGVGELPDADLYGDSGANTALHICQSIPGEKWPELRKLGLGNACENLGYTLPGCEPVSEPLAAYGVMAGKSPGKDTTTGHWELAGIILDAPFLIFPAEEPSFPDTLITAFTEQTGLEILGNRSASGTEIIRELGDEHVRTGRPICYTSADSVFQIAAHEEVIPIERLYHICEIARGICNPLRVGRVIARPFVTDERGEFVRTSRRRDFSIDLPGPAVMDLLQEGGIATIGVGKIGDIFNGQGLSASYPEKGNAACLDRVLSLMGEPADRDEFIFVNLVDTDMLYGHRRDVEGYYRSVDAVDTVLPEIMERLRDEDLLIITADHGCDPTFRGTDHTREYVPLLAYGRKYNQGNVGIAASFSYVARVIEDFFLG